MSQEENRLYKCDWCGAKVVLPMDCEPPFEWNHWTLLKYRSATLKTERYELDECAKCRKTVTAKDFVRDSVLMAKREFGDDY